MKSKLITSLMVLFIGASLMAQTRITGTVKDNIGPMIGASVMEQGTASNGTVTDVDGNFALTVKPNATIVISSIGYKDQVIPIGNQTRFDITLEEDFELLEETVVIGYGTQKKSDVTGSVASVDSEQMQKRTPLSVTQGLQGAAAGVVITQSSGDPAADMSIRIRGVATMEGDTNPLWVVDGIQYGTSSNLDWLDPQEVERIEVLKDASATAIYGARGANGVIMVTTRKAKAGKVRIDFKSDFGISTYANKLELTPLDEWLVAYRAANAADGTANFPAFEGPYDKQLNEIDWQDVMTQTSFRQQYNLSISGGSENVRSNFSIGYLDNKGIIVNSWNKRLTMRLNTDFTITKWLKAGVTMNFSTSKNKKGGNMLTYARITPTMDYIDNATGQLVNVPVVYPDGSFGHFTFDIDVDKTGGMYQTNPYADMNLTSYKKDWDNDNGALRSSAWAEITFFKGFTFRTNINYDFSALNSWEYKPAYIGTQYEYNQYAGSKPVDSFSTRGEAFTNLGVENYFTYDNTWGQHHLTAMIGQSASVSHGSKNQSGTKDLLFPFLRGFYSSNSNDYDTGGGAPEIQTKFASYFARLNYVFGGRYMFTATIRRDGSSNFGKDKRWGTFPSFSAAWNMGEERWLKNVSWLNTLKLRAGWGQTGNANVKPTSSVPQLSASGVSYDLYGTDRNYIRYNGLAQTKEIDTGLHWETSVQTNVGLDLGFLNNSITASIDYYIRDTKDLILAKAIRPSAGFTDITTNFGSIRNSGIEFAVGYKKQFNKDWFFSASVTGSTNKNEAVDIGTGTTTSGPQGAEWDNRQVCYTGLPLGTYYGYRVDHIIQTQSEIDALNAKAVEKYGEGSFYDRMTTAPGDFLMKDLNGDGHITVEDKDYLGNGFVDLNFGINLAASYKNWDASIYMYGALGQQVLSWSKRYLISINNEGASYYNFLHEVASNSWSPSNPDAIYPRFSHLDLSNNYRCSDYFVEKADYLKISNLQVGYTFDKKVLGKVFNSARVYLSIQNLATISPYNKFGDPEVFGGVTTTGLDTGRYPFPRTYMFGFQIGF